MTPAQAAEALQLPKNTVLALCRRGVLPARKLGRSWRILRAALSGVFNTAAPAEKTTGRSTGTSEGSP
jgi:excisionase family DNA binding protein